MKVKTSLYIQFGILVVACLIAAYYNSKMPDIVPTHWNIQGKADQYGSKSLSLILCPSMVLFGIVLTYIIPRISPKNFEIDRFETTFSQAMLLISCLFLYISIVILSQTAGAHFDIGRGLMAGIFLFFALLGNILGKIRQNFFMGIKTPWTLASEKVWDATHRCAGYLWFAGGLVGAALSLLGAPMVLSIIFLVAISIWPVIHSYLLYQKIGTT